MDLEQPRAGDVGGGPIYNTFEESELTDRSGGGKNASGVTGEKPPVLAVEPGRSGTHKDFFKSNASTFTRPPESTLSSGLATKVRLLPKHTSPMDSSRQ